MTVEWGYFYHASWSFNLYKAVISYNLKALEEIVYNLNKVVISDYPKFGSYYNLHERGDYKIPGVGLFPPQKCLVDDLKANINNVIACMLCSSSWTPM